MLAMSAKREKGTVKTANETITKPCKTGVLSDSCSEPEKEAKSQRETKD